MSQNTQIFRRYARERSKKKPTSWNSEQSTFRISWLSDSTVYFGTFVYEHNSRSSNVRRSSSIIYHAYGAREKYSFSMQFVFEFIGVFCVPFIHNLFIIICFRRNLADNLERNENPLYSFHYSAKTCVTTSMTYWFLFSTTTIGKQFGRPIVVVVIIANVFRRVLQGKKREGKMEKVNNEKDFFIHQVQCTFGACFMLWISSCLKSTSFCPKTYGDHR